MMIRNLVFIAAILSSVAASAQGKKKSKEGAEKDDSGSANLVVNGGFEELNLKSLKTYGQLTELCTPWLSPNPKSADLFSVGVKGTKAGVPVNDFGVQEPLSGSAYAGFIAFTKDPKKTRTYLQAKLKSTLAKDQLYCVRFNLSLAELSKFGVNNVGVFFSDREVNNNNDNALTFKPQVLEKSNKPITLMDGWETVCNTYIATGKEGYLIIGGFGEEDQIKQAKVKKPAGTTGTVQNSAYYYIDDIEIEPITAGSECKCGAEQKREDDVIYSKAGAKSPDMTPEQFINSTGVYFPFLSAEINGQFLPELEEVAGILKADPNIRIALTGHSETDEVNEAKVNPRVGDIARRRAEAVKAYFTDLGISESRITVEVKDDSEPANTSGTPIGRASNRRVIFRKQ